MSFQEVIAKNQILVAVIAAVVLAFAAYRMLRSTGIVQTRATIYYFDVQAGELFTAPQTGEVPIPAPSGGDGVIAHVYACNDCADDADRFVAYLEKLTDDARAEMTKEQPNLQVLTEGKVIAPGNSPGGDDLQWVPMDSPHGAHITGIAYEKCERPKACKP